MENNSQELSFENEFHRERFGLSGKRIALLVIALLILAAGITVAAVLLKPKTQLVINEVMTANHGAYTHPVYRNVDWVELYNPTDKDIDLSGFGFTNSIKDLKRSVPFHFADGTIIKSHGYLVLYCTGGTGETDDDPLCTGFKLSKDGETLLLIDRNNVECAELTVPKLEADTSYARTEKGDYAVTTVPTPAEANRFE